MYLYVCFFASDKVRNINNKNGYIAKKNYRLMKTSFLVPFLIFLSVLSSCYNYSPKSTLSDIDSFIKERPDSALLILDTMDRALLRKEDMKAHHALLYAMALDKNFINVSDDSIARVAVDYYSKHGSRVNYARSLYYLGLAYFYQEEYNKAIVEFTRAEAIAMHIDSLYLGFAKVGLADTYACTYNHVEEEKNLSEAYQIFCLLENKYYSQAVALRLSQVYSVTDRIQEAEKIITQLMDDPEIADNLMSSALVSLAYMNVMRSNPDLHNAETLFRKNNVEYAGDNMTIKHYWAWAYSLHVIGRYEEAQEIINQIIDVEPESSSYWQYQIAKSEGETASALAYLEECIRYNDDKAADMLEQSIALSQRDFYESLADLFEYKTHNARLTIIIIVLVFFFSSLLVFILVKMYVKKQEYIKEKNLLYISEIKRQLEEAEREDYPLLKKKYLALYRTKFETIGTLYEHLMNTKDLTNAEKSIYKKVDALVISFTQDYRDSNKFESMLDNDLDNIMSNLRSEVPNLKPKDYSIFSLFVIGFDVTTISHLLNTTMNTIYVRKSRIKRHIEELNPMHKTQFLDVLR